MLPVPVAYDEAPAAQPLFDDLSVVVPPELGAVAGTEGDDPGCFGIRELDEEFRCRKSSSHRERTIAFPERREKVLRLFYVVILLGTSTVNLDFLQLDRVHARYVVAEKCIFAYPPERFEIEPAAPIEKIGIPENVKAETGAV
jgi:hypothetical protein